MGNVHNYFFLYGDYLLKLLSMEGEGFGFCGAAVFAWDFLVPRPGKPGTFRDILQKKTLHAIMKKSQGKMRIFADTRKGVLGSVGFSLCSGIFLAGF